MRSHFVSWLVSELGSVLKSPFSLLLLTYSIRNRIRAIGNSARPVDFLTSKETQPSSQKIDPAGQQLQALHWDLLLGV